MVDAEHSHFQPAIDALALRLQQRYNRAEPIILNTYQVCMAQACTGATGSSSLETSNQVRTARSAT